jgi:hypothetical protein
MLRQNNAPSDPIRISCGLDPLFLLSTNWGGAGTGCAEHSQRKDGAIEENGRIEGYATHSGLFLSKSRLKQEMRQVS